MRQIVTILDSALVPDSTECDLEREVLAPYAEVRQLFVDAEAEIVTGCADADAVIVWHHVRLTGAALKQFRKCKAILRNGVGYDNVDAEAAAQFGIPVCNVPDYGTEEVADHSIALALALARRLNPAAASVRAGGWDWRAAQPVLRFSRMVFGIVGCGRIGTAAALRAKALGFRVVFYDPFVPSGFEKALGVERAPSLDELLSAADILSLHVPLTETTRHMIAASALALMKPGALLVNTARGPVVREADLVEALRSGRLAGAGLDVVEQEPSPAPELLGLPNCIVTPHCAFYSEHSWPEMRHKAALAVVDALVGRPLANVVNGVSQQPACAAR